MALDDAELRLCAGCSSPVDPVWDHALCYAKLGVYARHSDIRDEFAALCVESGLSVELEKGTCDQRMCSHSVGAWNREFPRNLPANLP